MTTIDMQAGLTGEYQYRLIKKDLLGREYIVKESDWITNRLTENIYDVLFLRGHFNNYCYIGKDSKGNLEHFAEHGYVLRELFEPPSDDHRVESSILVQHETSPYHALISTRYRFDPIRNVNIGNRVISEMGVGTDRVFQTRYLVDKKALVSRVVVDPPIIQLPDQYLDIIFRLKMVFPRYDKLITINNIVHRVIGTPANFVDNAASWYFVSTFFNNNHISSFFNLTATALTNNTLAAVNRHPFNPIGSNFYLKTTHLQNPNSDDFEIGTYQENSGTNYIIFKFNPHEANFSNGISTIYLQCITCDFQFQFDPPIMKTDKDILNIRIDLGFKINHSLGEP